LRPEFVARRSRIGYTHRSSLLLRPQNSSRYRGLIRAWPLDELHEFSGYNERNHRQNQASPFEPKRRWMTNQAIDADIKQDRGCHQTKRNYN
jgi:hypothetical protein